MVPDFTEEDWHYLKQTLTVQTLQKGTALIRNGDICRQVSFINKGLLRLYYLADGKEVATGFVPENNYVSCYASFLTSQPSSENIDVLEDCELINLSFTDMQTLYNTRPVFERFGRKIAEQLFILISSQTTRLLSLSPEERYQYVIRNQPYIIQRVPQYMIASYIGITPEHLSRLRKKMAT